MATDFSYLEKYYGHLYTVTGGKLRIESRIIPFLGGEQVYQVTVESEWSGRRYAGAYRMLVKDAEAGRSIRNPSEWGHPHHPLVYQAASLLRELCKTLDANGCEYAIPLF